MTSQPQYQLPIRSTRDNTPRKFATRIFFALTTAVIVGYTTPGVTATALIPATVSDYQHKLNACSGSQLGYWEVTVQEFLDDVTTVGCQLATDTTDDIGYKGNGASSENPWQINLKVKYKNGSTTITHLATVRPGGITDFLPSAGNSLAVGIDGALITGICVDHFNDYRIHWTAPTYIVQGGVTYDRISMEWKLDTSNSDSVTVKAEGAGITCVNVTQCSTTNVDTWIDVDSNCPGGVYEDDWYAQFVHEIQQG